MPLRSHPRAAVPDPVSKSFRMRFYVNRTCKSFRIRSYEKQPRGVGAASSTSFAPYASYASFTSLSAMLKFTRHRYDHP